MRPRGVGLRRARTSLGLRPTRPGLANGGVPGRATDARRRRPSSSGVYMPRAEGWGVPDDAGVVDVAVVGLDVADGVALVEEVAALAVVVEVSGDGSV